MTAEEKEADRRSLKEKEAEINRLHKEGEVMAKEHTALQEKYAKLEDELSQL
jgi:predicted nuclease with TOPRIM domain